MGVKFAVDTTNLLYILGSIFFGVIAGTVIGVDARLTAFGDAPQRRFSPSDRSRSSARSRTGSPVTRAFC